MVISHNCIFVHVYLCVCLSYIVSKASIAFNFDISIYINILNSRQGSCDFCVPVCVWFCFDYIFFVHLCFIASVFLFIVFAALPPLVIVLTGKALVICVFVFAWFCFHIFVMFFTMFVFVFVFFCVCVFVHCIFGAPSFGNCIDRQGSARGSRDLCNSHKILS